MESAADSNVTLRATKKSKKSGYIMKPSRGARTRVECEHPSLNDLDDTWVRTFRVEQKGDPHFEYEFDGELFWKEGVVIEALRLATLGRASESNSFVFGNGMKTSMMRAAAHVSEGSAMEKNRTPIREWICDIIEIMNYFHERGQEYATVFTSRMLREGICVLHSKEEKSVRDDMSLVRLYPYLCEIGDPMYIPQSVDVQCPENLMNITLPRSGGSTRDIWKIGSCMIVAWSKILGQKVQTADKLDPNRRVQVRRLREHMDASCISILDEWPGIGQNKNFQRAISITDPTKVSLDIDSAYSSRWDFIPHSVQLMIQKAVRFVPRMRTTTKKLKHHPLFASIQKQIGINTRYQCIPRPSSRLSGVGGRVISMLLADHKKQTFSQCKREIKHKRARQHAEYNIDESAYKRMKHEVEATVSSLGGNMHALCIAWGVLDTVVQTLPNTHHAKIDMKVSSFINAIPIVCSWMATKVVHVNPVTIQDLMCKSEQWIDLFTIMQLEKYIINLTDGYIDQVSSIHFLRVFLAEMCVPRSASRYVHQTFIGHLREMNGVKLHPAHVALDVILNQSSAIPENQKRCLLTALQSIEAMRPILSSVPWKTNSYTSKHPSFRCAEHAHREKELRKRSCERHTDPAQALPGEIFGLVLSFLKREETIRVACVSKRWNRSTFHPLAHPTPWVIPAREYPNVSENCLLKSIIPRFSVSNDPFINVCGMTLSIRSLLTLLFESKKLKHFNLKNTKRSSVRHLQIELSDAHSTLEVVNETHLILPHDYQFNLESINLNGSNVFQDNSKILSYIIHRSPKLKMFHSIRSTGVTSQCIQALSSPFNLRDVALDINISPDVNKCGCCVTPADVKLLFRNMNRYTVPSVECNMMKLKLRFRGNNSHRREAPLGLMACLLDNIPNGKLESLCLMNYSARPQDIECIAERFSNIRELRISSFPAIQMRESIGDRIAQLSDLRILAISHFTELTTEVVQRILDGCPALEVVKLCNGIVVDRIIGLLCKPRIVPLKRILFRNCRGFTSFAWNRMQVMCAQTTIDVIRGTND